MRGMAWPGMVALIAVLVGGSMTLHACGSTNNDPRDKGVCDACDPNEIDQDCVDQCLQFCPPGEDCEPRCQVECDRCRADLACVACVGGSCAAPQFRCAPPGGATTCDNGQF